MKIIENAKATNFSTYGGKGIICKIYLPETTLEFANILGKNNGTASILGGGSNTLIPDGENQVVVVSTSELQRVEVQGNFVRAEAGVRLSKLMKIARENNLGGIEFLSGIPASVGGIVKMNAGAFGAETAVYLDKITVLTADNAKIEKCAPFDFGYRKGACDVVLTAMFKLESVSNEESFEREREFLKRRRNSQPKGRSLGSVFKNTGLGAGYYIDKVGLKGTRRGGAEISTKHANFIVNLGDGSAEDYLYLHDLAKQRVYEEFGITLEREFVILGEKRH